MAVFEECGLSELIDEAVKYKGGRRLSPGNAVKAMIGPMLSVTGKVAVCRVDDFYASAPVDVMFGDSVEHRSLNDRALGDTLDELYGSDMQDLLWRCAERCRVKYGLSSSVYHMDATNFPVYVLAGVEEPEEGSIAPMYGGNSKNKRNDLRQYDAEIVTDGNRTLTYLRAYSGNTSDVEMNRDTVEFLKDRLDCGRSTIVADSKLVTEDLLKRLMDNDLGFISKCPENFSKKVKGTIVQLVETGVMTPSSLGKGYMVYDTEADTVCGRLRFLAYRSPMDRERCLKYHREQGDRLLAKAFAPLRKRLFNCIPDAEEEYDLVAKGVEDHGYRVEHTVVEHDIVEKRPQRGRPKKGSPPPTVTKKYGIDVTWTFDEDAARKLMGEDSVQVLVTNLPSSDDPTGNLRDGATSDEVLRTYLDEYKPEHTFRLLKSDIGMSKVYLHKPNREAAMMMVMGVAAAITSVIDCVLRQKEVGYTFNDLSWKILTTTVRYRRSSGYKFLDGPEWSGSLIKEYCKILEIDPDLMIGRK